MAVREGFKYHPLNEGAWWKQKRALTDAFFCGKGGIRTLGGPEPTIVFETIPFSLSGTFPNLFLRAVLYLNSGASTHLHLHAGASVTRLSARSALRELDFHTRM